jgi:hypothetical protein
MVAPEYRWPEDEAVRYIPLTSEEYDTIIRALAAQAEKKEIDLDKDVPKVMFDDCGNWMEWEAFPLSEEAESWEITLLTGDVDG